MSALPADTPSRRTSVHWQTRVAMTRPGFLSITLVGCVLGISIAAVGGHGPQWGSALASVVLALMMHAAANVFNDFHDAQSGADEVNTQGIYPFTGGARLIQTGVVSLQDTRQLAQLLLLLAVPAGLILSLYAGGGLLVIGSDYVQRGSFHAIPAALALSYGLLVGNILLINGFPDAKADAQVNKRTLVVRIGPFWAACVYLVFAVLAHGSLVVGVWAFIHPSGALLGLASLPFSLLAAFFLFQHAHEPSRLKPAIVLTILAVLVHGLAMALGLILMTLGYTV